MISRYHVCKLFIICAVLTCITNFPSGFTNSSVNTAVDELERFINQSYTDRGWNMTKARQSIVKSAILNCWFVAQVAGSFISPYITDKYGRKLAYLFSTAVMTFASGLQFVATLTGLPELLMLGRFTAAICSPLSDAALILYLQECSPLQYRGMFSFLGEIGYCLMCVLGMVMGMRAVLGSSLPKMLGYSIIPGLVSLIFLFLIPETPKYLMIVKHDRKQALESLQFFQGDKKENEQLLDAFLQEATHDNTKKRSSIKEVVRTWHLRFAVVLACTVLILTVPFYPFLQSSTLFFRHIGIKADLAELSSTLLMIAFTVACIVGSFFIDRWPRRFLVMGSGALATTFLSLFVLFSVTRSFDFRFKYAALGAVFGYAITFGMVLGPISWFVAPELVSQRHRSTVFCLCYGINNILIAITNFATVPLYDLIGAYTMVPLFIIPSIVCLVVIGLYLPETLGKETHEIVHGIRERRKQSVVHSDSSSGTDSDSENELQELKVHEKKPDISLP
ncbi:unnamed protein product [Bursaphelenchus okinawaensis]|uniref:Major facilitator superfamily (MFS) profile domain-containing protein n=1 Tax=Bursaphelenchus okinawaensis TaxID=465554 RepID=A0A811K6M4_9BILA|nr:unnamed protein product [Bursaphelenchus okinawaensis]CAG9092541.1 unnamed protein product [Bursaphelenchus okinawaensis]